MTNVVADDVREAIYQQMLTVCRELAKFSDCEEAADWKDVQYRLTSLAEKAVQRHDRENK